MELWLYFDNNFFEVAVGIDDEAAGLFLLRLLGIERDVVVEQGDFIAAGDKIVHDDLAEIVRAVFVALFVKAEVVDGLVFAVKGIEIERRGDGIYLLRQEECMIAVGLRQREGFEARIGRIAEHRGYSGRYATELA